MEEVVEVEAAVVAAAASHLHLVVLVAAARARETPASPRDASQRPMCLCEPRRRAVPPPPGRIGVTSGRTTTDCSVSRRCVSPSMCQTP